MSQFEAMIKELAAEAADRYRTATEEENMTPEEAMKEIVRTILETYREALSQ